jgi:hypothetical protein
LSIYTEHKDEFLRNNEQNACSFIVIEYNLIILG